MTKKERFNSIIGWFAEDQPVAQSELHFANPYQLLVAVILSAQCTDRRVNLVTPPLFERFPTPAELSSASFDDVYPYVKSVSYPNAKARHLIAMARMLMADYLFILIALMILPHWMPSRRAEKRSAEV